MNMHLLFEGSLITPGCADADASIPIASSQKGAVVKHVCACIGTSVYRLPKLHRGYVCFFPEQGTEGLRMFESKSKGNFAD